MSTQYRLVQSGKTASGSCSAGPRFVRACSATDKKKILIKSVTFYMYHCHYFACGPPCLLHYTDWPASHKRVGHLSLNRPPCSYFWFLERVMSLNILHPLKIYQHTKFHSPMLTRESLHLRSLNICHRAVSHYAFLPLRLKQSGLKRW
jgi:hypothetical protein